MLERRVVITGMGAVSCAGNSVNSLWDALRSGRSGIGKLTLFDAGDLPVYAVGEVRDLVVPGLTLKEQRRTARFTRFAYAAAHEAMTQAGLLDEERGRLCACEDPFRTGTLISSGIGGAEVYDANSALVARGKSVSTFCIPTFNVSSATGSTALRYGLRGPGFSIASACASSAHAIGEAAWIIRRGDADVMLAGGAEACIVPVMVSGFLSLTALSMRQGDPAEASRPFDRDRDGFVIAEGAAVLILEELEHARRRGAVILAELAGYGASCDAWHITSPDPEGTGAANAMQSAMKHACCRPEEIGYVSAHGTGTKLNDLYETRAIRKAFGTHADRLSVSSVKSMIGHALGAAGALASVGCVRSLESGIIPPTINCDHPDPECDLDVTPGTAVTKELELVMSNSMGFGGHNAALIFKRWKDH